MAARPTTTRPAVLLMFQLTHCARQVFCQSDLLLERVHTLGQCIDLGVLLLEHVDLLFGWKNQCQTGANFGAKNSAKRRYRPMRPVAPYARGNPCARLRATQGTGGGRCGTPVDRPAQGVKADGLWLNYGRSTQRQGSLMAFSLGDRPGKAL